MNAIVQSDELNIALFDTVADEVRDCLMSRAVTRRVSRGTTICLQGETARSLKIIAKGWVKLYRVNIAGSEAVLSTLGAGESFDEMAALQQGTSIACAEAVTDCTLLMLDLSAIQSCEKARGQLDRAIMKATNAHLAEMASHIEHLKVRTGIERLTDFLLELSASQNSEGEVELPFGKAVLAAQLGMKPESLSRAFNQLKPLGVDSDLRRIRIRDIAALRGMSVDHQACA